MTDPTENPELELDEMPEPEEDPLLEELPTEMLEGVFAEIAEKAVNGNLKDHDRVILFRLGFSIAAEEFQRISETYGEQGNPAVNPTVLMLMQQIALLTEGDEVELSKLVNPMTGEPFVVPEDSDVEE